MASESEKTTGGERQVLAADPSGLPGSVRVFMTSKEFAAIGAEIYGARWKSPLARRLGLSRLWVRQMAEGSVIIPETTALAMLALDAFETLR